MALAAMYGSEVQGDEGGKTFTWLGYRQTAVEWTSVSIRARHYAAFLGNWTSVDPLWPSEMPYEYVENRVMTGVDPSGMQNCPPLRSCYTMNPKDCYLCAYHALRRADYQPRTACEVANDKCWTKKKCGLCGHLTTPKVSSSCFHLADAWKFHKECGVTGDVCDKHKADSTPVGHDKMAHCFFWCAFGQCASQSGAQAYRHFYIAPDDVEFDELANHYGGECADEAIGFSRCLLPYSLPSPTTFFDSQACIECCAKKVKRLPIHTVQKRN